MAATGWIHRSWLLSTLFAAALSVPGAPALAVNTCNGLLTIDYVAGPVFSIPGDTIRVQLTLGTGSIQGGTKLNVNRVRFDLDCNSGFALGVPCTDEGAKIEYQGDGTITTTCGVAFTTGHAVSSAPNQVVFTPSSTIMIPPNQAIPPGFCNLEFDVKILAPSTDVTPTLIEQVAGFLILPSDAMCDNGLSSGSTQASSIPLCPACNDNNPCTTDACNQNTGQCVFTNLADSAPCPDNDGNACTTAGCTGTGTCDQNHLVVVCQPDGIDCTEDPPCNTITGTCDHPARSASTPCTDTDGNACTAAGCTGSVGGAFLGCDQNHVVTVCTPDANDCTNDPPCNPATGLCEHPNTPDSTPCGDTDGDACTDAGCNGSGTCDQVHIATVCTPDANPCTDDPPCNPANGLCEKPPVADSTPCADGDGNACTTAGCEAGTCVQTHQQTICTPDSNDCTDDPPCNPANGLCEHPSVQNSTPCPDTDSDACTTAGCEASTCVQSHITCTNAPLHHYQCYEVRKDAFTGPTVSLQDRFGTESVLVQRPDRLCAPANKRNEDPPAPADPIHLAGYRIRPPKLIHPNQVVMNQFGTTTVDIIKPDRLMVPTTKSLTATPPAAPGPPTIDHFKCYKIRRTVDTPPFVKQLGVPLVDQFGPITVDLLKPLRLCTPVNKNTEDPTAPAHPLHLLCYRAKVNVLFGTLNPFITNQFGSQQVELIRRQEFCVPSTVQ